MLEATRQTSLDEIDGALTLHGAERSRIQPGLAVEESGKPEVVVGHTQVAEESGVVGPLARLVGFVGAERFLIGGGPIHLISLLSILRQGLDSLVPAVMEGVERIHQTRR